MKESTRNYFFYLLSGQAKIVYFIITLILIVISPSFALKIPTTDPLIGCEIFAPESHPLYTFIEESKVDTMWINNMERRTCCSMVKQGHWTLNYGNTVLLSKIYRFSICQGFDPTINTRFYAAAKEKDVPPNFFKVYEKFCMDTTERLGNTTVIRSDKEVIEKVIWLRTELFCQSTRYIAHSDGWEEVLRPSDFHSVRRLESAAISICDDLRDGKIQYNEAVYRWEQELLWFDNHFSKEIVQDFLKKLNKPIKALLKSLLEKFK